jgi:hypothetical protein
MSHPAADEGNLALRMPCTGHAGMHCSCVNSTRPCACDSSHCQARTRSSGSSHMARRAACAARVPNT